MRPGRDAGFTLLEALVALVILMLAATALTRTLVTGLVAGTRAERESMALETARNALAVAAGSGATPITVTTRLANGLERTVSVRLRPDLVAALPGPAPRPYQIDATVRWYDGARPRSLTLSSLRLDPRY